MVDSSKRFYHVTISTLELNTIGNYCGDYSSPAFKFVGNETDFLDLVDDDGVTNRQRLYDTYNSQETANYLNYSDKNLPLKLGVRFCIPVDKVERNGLLTQGLLVVSNSDVAFKANALAEIESDPTYVAVTKPIDGETQLGVTKESVPECTVWIFCRNLSDPNSNPSQSPVDALKGQIFDITPFISGLTTNVTKGAGGNFSFSLPPLVCSLDESGKWQITKNNITQYVGGQNSSLGGDGYVAEGSLYDQNLNRNQFLFHNIISSNDIVIIRFETLQIEKNDRLSEQGQFFIDKNQIPGKIYDMIGLVDLNSISVTPATNDVSITITGRDLSKLFIEDGSYYYTLEQNGGKQFGQGQSGSGLVKRIVSDTAASFYELWYNQSIERIFRFIIDQVSNIKICPDDLFSAYDTLSTNKRSTRFDSADIYKAKPRDQTLMEFQDNAITAIRQLRFANGLSLSDNNSESNFALTLFNDLSNFLQAIRDNNVRVTVDNNLTQTWLSFSWTNPNKTIESVDGGQLPNYFDGKLYDPTNLLNGLLLPNQNYLDDIFLNIDSYLNVQHSKGKYGQEFREVVANGIWQIMKLVVDKGISNRRLNDASISTASGSLMNFFNKVIQEPFVEMIFDTYSDVYAITLRKPPTDQIGLISLIEGKVQTEDGRVKNGTPAIVDVEAYDVLKEELHYNDSNAYSWYHLTPECDYINNDAFSYAYLPGLYFSEYADIWGSKPMDLSHKYMPQLPLDSNETDLTLSQKQAVYDLKYMIDSNMHNPFTRKGTLVLNGDRRLKVGNIFRYKPTGEIFHIDAVQQNFKIGESMIDRTTTVQVSRGMVEQLIYGIPYQNSQNQEADHISYFNIINTKLNFRNIVTSNTVKTKVPNGFKIVTPEKIGGINDKYPKGSYEELQEASMQTSSDGTVKNRGLEKLLLLQPTQKDRFIQLIANINKLTINGAPILVEITSTVRTAAQQQIQYSKNNSKVKNAAPGHSSHEASNGGLAVDLNLIIREAGKYTQSRMITSDYNQSAWMATQVPQLADKLGFKWGGDSFGTYYDPVHFQIMPEVTGSSTREQQYKTVTETKTSTSLDQSAIFSNFKVNNHVFNFFFKKMQFDEKYNSGTINRKLYSSEVKEAIG